MKKFAVCFTVQSEKAFQQLISSLSNSSFNIAKDEFFYFYNVIDSHLTSTFEQKDEIFFQFSIF